MTESERNRLPAEYGIMMDEYKEYDLFRENIEKVIESAIKSLPIGSTKKQAKHIADYIYKVD